MQNRGEKTWWREVKSEYKVFFSTKTKPLFKEKDAKLDTVPLSKKCPASKTLNLTHQNTVFQNICVEELFVTFFPDCHSDERVLLHFKQYSDSITQVVQDASGVWSFKNREKHLFKNG